MRYALEVALENDIPSAALRGYNNVADLEARSDRYERAAAGLPRRPRARAPGRQPRSRSGCSSSQTYPLYSLGRWDEALAQAAEVPEDAFSQTRFPFVCFLGNSVAIHCHRGELDAAAALIAALRRAARLRRPDRACQLRVAGGSAALARRPARRCARVASAAWEYRDAAGISSESMKETFTIAVEAALAVGDLARAERAARRRRCRCGRAACRSRCAPRRCGSGARMAAADGDDERADSACSGAAPSLLRELATPVSDGGRHASSTPSGWPPAAGAGEAETGLAEARADLRGAARGALHRAGARVLGDVG